MVSLEPILDHFAPFLLVLFRVTGLFLFTPVLSSTSLPRTVRAMVAFSFSIAIYPFVPPESVNPPVLDAFILVPLMISEVMIGVAIGLLVQLPLLGLQMGGGIMGYQMGLALAQSYNPEMNAQSSAIGQILFLMGAMGFVAFGGIDAVFLALAETFRTMPVGVFAADRMPLDLFVTLLTSAFDFAIRIAAPTLGVISLILVSLGFLMKTMPEINVMSVGFAFKIVSGITALTAVIVVIDTVAADAIRETLMLIHEWVSTMPGGGG